MKKIARIIAVGCVAAAAAACTRQATPDAHTRDATTLETAAADDESETGLRTVRVNGVELHYLEKGEGVPLVLVHGSLADYREWEPVMDRLAAEYRVIVYSRRYNFPNRNAELRPDHSALVEAEDLAAFIEALELAPAHVGGLSYGAYTALLLSLQRPELVRRLVLVEPVIARWLLRLPGGLPYYEWIMNEWWEPTGQAYRAGDPERALRITFGAYLGDENAWDQLPPAYREAVLANSREWEALATSSDAYPDVQPEAVRGLRASTLMIGGADTGDFNKLIDAELERLIPNVRRVVVPEATHEVVVEHPDAVAAAMRDFLGERQARGAGD